MEIMRRNYGSQRRLVYDNRPGVTGAPNPGREETMRQVTRIHRTLTVLAVGLLALAAPLLASANTGGPGGG